MHMNLIKEIVNCVCSVYTVSFINSQEEFHQDREKYVNDISEVIGESRTIVKNDPKA